MCFKNEMSNCKLCGKFYCKTTSELPLCKKCLNSNYIEKKKEQVISTVEKKRGAYTRIVGIIQSTTTKIIYEEVEYEWLDIKSVKYFSKTEKMNRKIEVKDFEYKTLT